MSKVSRRLTEQFFRLLMLGGGEDVFNPWTQRDELTDGDLNSPASRVLRLRLHLQTRPARILVGEAAGYQGCHVSGIPFTSERMIIAGAVPRVRCESVRMSVRTRPWSEPSATVVWNTLHHLNLARDTVLWNAYPWHPHKHGSLHSNRTPTRSERTLGMPVLDALLQAFPKATVFAVGRQAEQALAEAGRHATPLRHPSMGGARKFALGLRQAL
jgi:uracil-DNA glycosylase